MSTPADDFQFKVQTVRWFGILCAAVIVGMIVLGFVFLDRLVERAGPYTPTMDVAKLVTGQDVTPALVTLGLEHDGMGMRDKRAIAALYMRAYVQFLAIVSGTVLSLLGAVFVLARVDSTKFDNDLAWGKVKWVLSSSSPGVVIALFGVLLIGSVVYFASTPITVEDGPAAPGLLAADDAPSSQDDAADTYDKVRDDALADIRRKSEVGK